MSIRVLELFAGIGACSKALTNLGIDHDIVDAVEIDKYAVASFNAIHGTNFVPQDITTWDKDIKCDLIMHGSPCQDFSVAGKNAGGDEGSGTRSSLMYETLRIVEKLKPKYVIWENVKNLLSAKHQHNFDAYLERMTELGYKNYYQVLNAKDYGVPQNRERVFTVSIRLDVPYCWAFKFPARRPLTKRLKDVLENEVDEKYYIDDNRIKAIKKWEERQIENGRGFRFEVKGDDSIGRAITTSGDRPSSTNYIKVVGKLDIKGQDQIKRVYDKGGVSPTLSTMQGGNRQPKIMEDFIKVANATKKGYDLATDGDSINLQYPNSKTRRGRVGHGVSQTLQANASMGAYQNYRIRRLTPKECWRLMGFDDTDFEKAEKVNSNTQLYKQAGNSIVVNVLEEILEELLHGNAD